MQLDLFNPTFTTYNEIWDIDDFVPTEGCLIQLSGIHTDEKGVRRGDFFKNGYLIRLYKNEEKALCWFPTVIGCPWINPIAGMVDFSDFTGINEYGFDEATFRENYPLPKFIEWKGEKIIIKLRE